MFACSRTKEEVVNQEESRTKEEVVNQEEGRTKEGVVNQEVDYSFFAKI